MIHPRTELREVDPVIGCGVFATALIPKGTIVWVTDPLDRYLTPGDLKAMPGRVARELLLRHTWRTKEGLYALAWDNSRFVNHSCSPNVLATDFGFEIAVRDILPGEEMTNDYANLGLQRDEHFHCARREQGCRGEVHFPDAARLKDGWSAQIADILPLASQVAQPLDFLLSADVRDKLRVGVKVRERKRVPRFETMRQPALAID